jgi:hypothetical protein
MSTKTEICNIALGLIGANLVIDVDADDSTEARLCRINYLPAKLATLESQEWSFAIRRFNPSLDAAVPLYGWGNQFTVPPDIIRVISCDNPKSVYIIDQAGLEPEQINWDFENGKILANVDVVYARGITQDVNEGDFSPAFVQAFAARIAMMVAIPLTQSQQLFQNAGGLYAGFLKEAKTRDGMQGRSKRIRNRSMLRVR